jgi:hypothetical protein
MKKKDWRDHALDALKYRARARADERGYFLGIGFAVVSLVLMLVDDYKGNKAKKQFDKEFNHWAAEEIDKINKRTEEKEENANEKEN